MAEASRSLVMFALPAQTVCQVSLIARFLAAFIPAHLFCRHWRLTGVAYELRDSSYTATNTSMLSTAYGRTKEYKDR